MAAAAVSIGQVTRALAALSGQRRAGVRLGRHQPRHHHQHARPLVRQEARHGDQPGAERRQLRRHRRRAAAGGGDRLFRFLRRDDRVGDRDGRADGAGDPDFRRTAAAARRARAPSRRRMRRRRRRSARGRFAISASSRCRSRVRAGAVRAGRLHRPPDLVPRSGDRARARGDRGRAVDGDGGGRPRAVLDRDRPAQPAAGLGAVVRQPGRGARWSSSTCTTTMR